MSSQIMQEKANRLINEKSPYLLQHAYNPVEWYPWSDEAFAKAKAEDKPIFLSIGYSTCHWCHVMERESFEDEEVAKLLNDNFISVKVDREERPDVDSVYMDVCQAVTGSGGWPLTIIMTGDKKPFFAGTYFPKRGKYNMPGIMDILENVSEAWKNRKEQIISSSNKIVDEIKSNYHSTTNREEIGIDVVERAFRDYSSAFQSEYGGFNRAPKFPTPHNLYLLLRYWKVNNSEKALEMVTRTLDSMYKGGIFDHIGFGFSRYSTDEKWLVPHFEKMLYDNALLAICYLEAYQATGKKLYSEVAEKVFTYILRDMKHTGGGFYSAEDADSEGEEGKFYLWSYEEIISLLGEEKGKLFCNYYDITQRGNFENRNIPNLINTNLDEIEDNKQTKDILEDLSKDLFIYREKRIHPHKDDKILTSWNGLMIAALAYGGKVLKNDSYINEAKEAVRFIYEKLVREDGRLLARYREGEAAYLAYSDDYAFLIWGLIELYEATFDFQYLKKATDLNNDMYRYFWDKEDGGFFLYGEDSEELIWRPKEIYDGAIPSGNSVAALNILKLGKLTGDLELEERVKKMFKVFGGRVKEIPTAYSYFIIAVLYSNISGKDIVISCEQNNHDAKTLINEINKSFQPFTTVVLNNGDEELYKIAPNVKEKASIDGKTTIHICENFSCRRPITNIEEAINVLK